MAMSEDGYGTIELQEGQVTFRYYPEDGTMDVVVDGKHRGRMDAAETMGLNSWLRMASLERETRKENRS